jgi:hypothetical protein
MNILKLLANSTYQSSYPPERDICGIGFLEEFVEASNSLGALKRRVLL